MRASYDETQWDRIKAILLKHGRISAWADLQRADSNRRYEMEVIADELEAALEKAEPADQLESVARVAERIARMGI